MPTIDNTNTAAPYTPPPAADRSIHQTPPQRADQQTAQRSSQPTANPRPNDSLTLSDAARSADERRTGNTASDTPDTAAARPARIQQLRDDIASERYPTDETLDTALDRLIDDAERWFNTP